MDAAEFRSSGREMVDYVADYLESVKQRQPVPNVQPGYLTELVPEEAPAKGETWEAVMKDIDRVIMPGVRILPACSSDCYRLLVVYPVHSITVLTVDLKTCCCLTRVSA